MDALVEACRELGGAETYPFGPTLKVWKVEGKMFALIWQETSRINLKCEPAALPLLLDFPGIYPAYHMNKTHWLTLDPSVAQDGLTLQLLDTSYELVVANLPKRLRDVVNSGAGAHSTSIVNYKKEES